MSFSKPLPVLGDMPWHIKEKIVSYTGPMTKLALRKSSCELREYADMSEMRFSSVFITIHETMIELETHAWEYDPTADEYRKECVSIEYHLHSLGCLLKRGTNEKLISRVNYIDLAMKDFTSLIRSPKAEVTTLHFKLDTAEDASGWQDAQKAAVLESIRTSVTGFKHQLKVRRLKVDFALSTQETLRLLGVMQPGFLKELSIRVADEEQGIQRIMETEHWKQAQHLNWDAAISPSFTELFHFRGLTLQTSAVTLEDLRNMVQSAIRHGKDFDGITVERALFVNWQNIDDYFVRHLDFEDDDFTSYRIKLHDSGFVVAMELYNEKVVIRMEDTEDM